MDKTSEVAAVSTPGERHRDAGLLKRVWDFIVVMAIGFKFTLIETFTRHRKVNLQVMPKRTSETAVITGGARGIGAEIVKQLMVLDIHVIIGCRNPSAGVKMVDGIRQQGIQTGSAEVLSLDLNSLTSVRQFSQILLDRNLPINLLINNAGIMFAPFNITTDGFESQFQTNYLSHFLLTNLLLPLIVLAGTTDRASRIVNVTSCAHYGGRINFKDLNMTKGYSKYMAYMSSKLMQAVSTKEMDTRMKSSGHNVKVYCAHPGMVNTDLYEHVWWFSAFNCILRMFMRTPEEGADGIVYLAVSPDVESQGGDFYSNCKVYSGNPKNRNVELQANLWKVSKELVGMKSVDVVDATTDLK